MAFRKPEVSVGGVSGTEVIVHPPEIKEPLPLTIHHLPIAITFGTFEVSHALMPMLIYSSELVIYVLLIDSFALIGSGGQHYHRRSKP